MYTPITNTSWKANVRLALETTLYFVCCLTEGLLNRPIDSHAIKEEMGGNEDI